MTAEIARKVLEHESARIAEMTVQQLRTEVGGPSGISLERVVDGVAFDVKLELHEYRDGAVDLLISVSGPSVGSKALSDLIPIRGAEARRRRRNFWRR
ncbi:hypothetical protein GCM10009821_29430 [Aeromicrobium halocynthiae]|uniref:Uncharacterized protein n=1 Tax=Aeromicrobium halocynthiae TaxID=560557 RepID=A0ABN2W7N1_9ACTN